jgi:iron complex outermembrane receptor protein
VQTAEVGDLQLSIRGLNTGRDAETNFALVIDGVLQTNPTCVQSRAGERSADRSAERTARRHLRSQRSCRRDHRHDAQAGAGLRRRRRRRRRQQQRKKAHVYLGGGSEAVQFGVGGFYRETDGFFENSFLGCDDCVDYYKEYGVTPRLVMPMGDNGELDVKAKYSKLEAGAINFNATFALPFFATFTNNPDFFQDVNDHEFNYISNIVPTTSRRTSRSR